MFEIFYVNNGGKKPWNKSWSSQRQENIGMFSQSHKPQRVKRDETFISNETSTLDVFWVSNSNRWYRDILFFNITGYEFNCCYGYNHCCYCYNYAKPRSPRIIHICQEENKNRYVVFIVYEDDVVRLRLSINTNYDSSLSLTISSIDSWETVCHPFLRSIILGGRKDNPDQNRADPNVVIEYVINEFYPK